MDALPPVIRLDPAHFLGALGVGMTDAPGVECRGWARVREAMFVPGIEVVRAGYLATMVDLVAGNPPWGPLNPTIDLRLQVLTRPPATGRIRLDLRSLRSTRTLYWGETLLYADDDPRPFARSTTTFRNREPQHGSTPLRFAEPAEPIEGPIESLFAAARPAPGVVVVANRIEIGNPAVGTIQGGAQAVVAELAAEDLLQHATGRPHTVVDLDVRYLDRVRVGPMRATATLLPGGDHDEHGAGSTRHVSVVCSDDGDAGRIVSHTVIGAVAR